MARYNLHIIRTHASPPTPTPPPPPPTPYEYKTELSIFFHFIKLHVSARLKHAKQMKCLKQVLRTQQPVPG